jgi:hypothetical protein
MKKTTLFKVLLFANLIILTLGFSQQKKANQKLLYGKKVTTKTNPENGLVRCVTTEYELALQRLFPERATTAAFENWIAPQIAKMKANQAAGKSTSVVVTIPVVIHIIHNGTAIGTGANIAEARAISQITVLNQDFRRMTGTPGFNTNPVGADIEIQFCLAKTDPDGALTTGINRVNLGVANWSTMAQVEGTLKPQTQWDPTRYFNIWVCQFSSAPTAELAGTLGYAQFPSTSGLAGLGVNGGLAATDGVIIDYRTFGSKTLANVGTYFTDNDKGRTATHEIGHCFGLRHIWGDGTGDETTASPDCTATDYCADTPQAGWEHYVCGTFDTCPGSPGNDMVENYMDYSADACMNLFTQNQKDRMQAVLTNSPRRASLVTSTTCNNGQTYGYNAALKVVNLNTASCSVSFAPTLTITNKGTNTLTSAVVSYNIDGGTNVTYNWAGSLATNAAVNFTIPTISAGYGNHIFNYAIQTLNTNNTDQYSFNDAKSEAFSLVTNVNTNTVTINIQRDIYGSETSWSLINNTTSATIASGSGYIDTNTFLPPVFTQTVNVVNGNCYTFTINDSFGDGICCDYGPGFYELKATDNSIIAAGGEFGATESKNFGINLNLSNQAFNTLSKIRLYPNPANEQITISHNNLEELPDNIHIYNYLGQCTYTKKINGLSDLTIAISSYSSGVYFMKLEKEGVTKTLKFIKN